MPRFKVKRHSERAHLVRFSTGQLNPDAQDTVDFKSYSIKDNQPSDKKRLIVTTEVQGIKYSGHNHGMLNHFSTDTCDYYVAVHREGKEKVRVIPAELFLMQPQFEDKHVPESEQAKEKTYKEKRIDLVSQFGSGQTQRNVNKFLKTALEQNMVSATTDAVANHFVQTIGIDEGKDKSVTVCSAVPPHNKNAIVPEDIYLQETILPNWVMEALGEQSQVFVTCTPQVVAEWREKKEYPETVLGLLEKLSSDENERLDRCPLIMYLYCLIHSYKTSLNVLKNKAKSYPEWWNGLVKKLLDQNFIVETSGVHRSRTRPAVQKDMNLSHILVLYLRLSNYSIPMKPLSIDLKLAMKRISLHAEMLGCKVKWVQEQDVKMLATLVAPVKFPVMRNAMPTRNK